MKIRIITTLRDGIRDNQAIAVQHALERAQGFSGINNMRIGKIFDIRVPDDTSEEDIEKIAKAVSNPIMDDVKIQVMEEEDD